MKSPDVALPLSFALVLMLALLALFGAVACEGRPLDSAVGDDDAPHRLRGDLQRGPSATLYLVTLLGVGARS